MIFIGCIIKDKFNIYCPSCGGTRALKALLNFHFLESLYYNPIVLLIIMLIIFKFCHHRLKAINEQKLDYKNLVVSIIFLLIWFTYFIARNILLYYGIDLLGDITK